MSSQYFCHLIAMLASMALTSCTFSRPRFDVSAQYVGIDNIADVEVLIDRYLFNLGDLSSGCHSPEGRKTFHGSLPQKITVMWQSSQGVNHQRIIALGNEFRSRLDGGVLVIRVDDSNRVWLAIMSRAANSVQTNQPASIAVPHGVSNHPF
jgi:hypothetical protein